MIEPCLELFKSTFATVWFNLCVTADARREALIDLWVGWTMEEAHVLPVSWSDTDAEVLLIWDSDEYLKRHMETCEKICDQLSHIPDVMQFKCEHAIRIAVCKD
jgi:hypothetical protein